MRLFLWNVKNNLKPLYGNIMINYEPKITTFSSKRTFPNSLNFSYLLRPFQRSLLSPSIARFVIGCDTTLSKTFRCLILVASFAFIQQNHKMVFIVLATSLFAFNLFEENLPSNDGHSVVVSNHTGMCLSLRNQTSLSIIALGILDVVLQLSLL